MPDEIFDIDAKRETLAGPGGFPGLVKNARLFRISMITALGGVFMLLRSSPGLSLTLNHLVDVQACAMATNKEHVRGFVWLESDFLHNELTQISGLQTGNVLPCHLLPTTLDSPRSTQTLVSKVGPLRKR